MKGSSRERTGEERGAAAVEFAIIAPLLFMLVFGIIEFGLAWSQKNVYVGAAREGARYAATNCYPDDPCTNAKIATKVREAAVGYVLTNSPTAYVPGSPATSMTCTAGNTGQPIAVGWVQAFSINVPFLPAYNLTTRIEAVFRCES
jgi:Flp pilus assembly protein TadG